MVAGCDYSLFRSFFPLRAMLIIDRINFPDRMKHAGTPRSKKQMIIQMQAA